ncbi:Histone superfamily protein [Hibiscus syriacus]|uniref:Histone superfamily protein n=1 Tax=Hibiscus syriacus TaxID=106335 RepID=A0A6A3BHY8_HIBSY|nr:Histone superfamily protein [Hibiscus syriacus]
MFQAVFAYSKHESTSPFDFLRHLQGCHKGDNLKDVHKLKKHLEKFGYLSYKNRTHADDDNFDELIESAVRTYQLNYNLKATGRLDVDTVSKMISPRCGVADVIDGTSRMRLTYAFLPGTRADAVNPVVRAFQTWVENTHFRFSRTEDYVNADISVSFEGHDHGDGFPFDGPGGTLAHAFRPTDGRFHYDADEPWSVAANRGSYHLETVALHEIGHLIGLGHSSIEGAIMYPRILPGQSKGLHGDYSQGIRALHNF